MRYFLAAICFKCISASRPLKHFYRVLGNKKQARAITIKFTRWVWEVATATGTDQPQNKVLELGTGWTHANSLYLGLVGATQISAFDVIDNRSLASLKHQVPLVLADIESNPEIKPKGKFRARQRAVRIAQATSFEAVYKILNLEYRCDASGFPAFAPGSFDYIFSCDVLEHVRAKDFAALVQHWKTLLKPGGIFAAQVGLDDHIRHFDKTRHLKEYLKFPDRAFRWLICSNLQYINRLTSSAILAGFCAAGFTIESMETEHCDITGLKIHPNYSDQSPDDLGAVRLIFTARNNEGR